jgi:hypothetical protein
MTINIGIAVIIFMLKTSVPIEFLVVLIGQNGQIKLFGLKQIEKCTNEHFQL